MLGLTVLSILCALVPGAAVIVIGSTPVAAGFIIFVIADQKDHEGFRLMGAFLIALGLFVGAFAMALVVGSGG